MNLFNRLVVILLLVSLIAGAVAIAVLAWSIPNNTIAWLRDAVGWLAENNQDLEKSLLTAVCVAVAIVSLFVLILELLPQSSTEVKVTDLQVGNAYLSTAAISQRVEEAVNQVEHVSDVKAIIKAKRKGVRVSLDLHVDPEANLAVVTDQACEAARDVLTNRVHVALIEPPRARLHYRELRLQRASGARRTVPATPLLAAPREEQRDDDPEDRELVAAAPARIEESETRETPPATRREDE